MADVLDMIEEEIVSSSIDELKAYLAGAMHDGTISRRHNTARIAQSDLNWMLVLGHVFEQLGAARWFYREGNRATYVVESSYIPRKKTLSTTAEKTAYARGYFDAEGGCPHDRSARFYLQFCQKDRDDLDEVEGFLESFGVRTGRTHNPSHRVDPNYWRFFVSSESFMTFIDKVSSWHPRKRWLLEARQGVSQIG